MIENPLRRDVRQNKRDCILFAHMSVAYAFRSFCWDVARSGSLPRCEIPRYKKNDIHEDKAQITGSCSRAPGLRSSFNSSPFSHVPCSQKRRWWWHWLGTLSLLIARLTQNITDGLRFPPFPPWLALGLPRPKKEAAALFKNCWWPYFSFFPHTRDKVIWAIRHGVCR